MNKITPLLFITFLFTVTGCDNKKENTPDETKKVITSEDTNKTNTSEAPTKTDSNKDPLRIYDEANQYSILNPEGWMVERPDETTLLLRDPSSESGANIVLVIQVAMGKLSSKEYFEGSVKSLQKVVKDYKQISEGLVGDFHTVTFTHNVEDRSIKQTIYFLIKDSIGYSITATDYEENYDKNASLFERIATSLKLTK